MDKARIFLIIQSVIYMLAAVLLAGAAIGIYRDGMERRAKDPAADVYTREVAADAAAPGVVVLLVGVGLSVVGGVLGIRDKNADRPAADCVSSRDKGGRPEMQGLQKMRVGLLALAVVFVIIGIFNGSMNDVFVKAVKVCTECVGLG